jgi:hypothetical protein
VLLVWARSPVGPSGGDSVDVERAIDAFLLPP